MCVDYLLTIDGPGTKSYRLINVVNYVALLFTISFLLSHNDRTEDELSLLKTELISRIFILLPRILYCCARHGHRRGLLVTSNIIAMIVPLFEKSIYSSVWRGTFNNPCDWIILFNCIYSGIVLLYLLLLVPLLIRQRAVVADTATEATDASADAADDLQEIKIEMIHNLSEHVYTKVPLEEERRKCNICFCDFALGEMIKMLPCTHMFHSKCIERWLTGYKTNCPTCRFELFGDYIPLTVELAPVASVAPRCLRSFYDRTI